MATRPREMRAFSVLSRTDLPHKGSQASRDNPRVLYDQHVHVYLPNSCRCLFARLAVKLKPSPDSANDLKQLRQILGHSCCRNAALCLSCIQAQEAILCYIYNTLSA